MTAASPSGCRVPIRATPCSPDTQYIVTGFADLGIYWHRLSEESPVAHPSCGTESDVSHSRDLAPNLTERPPPRIEAGGGDCRRPSSSALLRRRARRPHIRPSCWTKKPGERYTHLLTNVRSKQHDRVCVFPANHTPGSRPPSRLPLNALRRRQKPVMAILPSAPAASQLLSRSA